MTPARLDFFSFNNEAFRIAVPITYKADGTPFDLTPYSALEMQVRATEASTVPALTLTQGAGITIEGAPTLGVLSLFASEANVQGLLGAYVYDLRGTADGKAEVIFYGTANFLQGKTYDLV